MKELKLLIVEDDENAINSYRREIASFNEERRFSFGNDINIVETSVQGKDEALAVLKKSDITFDGAIIDLDLLGTSGEDSSGNEVAREIKYNLRFPVFVITGTPQNIDEDLKEESAFFRIKTRGESEDEDYLEQFANIYNTGITQILNRKGNIEKYITEIFWNHLSNSLNTWINDSSRSFEQKQKSLLRYTLMHIQEYIDEDIEKYHPSEFYITKPIKRNIFTGDIVTYNKDRYIVLTPSCDIVLRENGRRNTNKILFCKIKKLNEEVKNYDTLTRDTGDNNNNKKRLLKFINNNSSQNFHFIPQDNSIDAGLIDFQDKMTIESTNVDDLIRDNNMIREATVSLPFLKDIISRYSNYYARQGSPDFNSGEIYNSLF